MNVIQLNVQTKLDVPVENVIDGANFAQLDEIIVIGMKEDGEFYFATSKASAPAILWLLERAKHELLERARDA